MKNSIISTVILTLFCLLTTHISAQNSGVQAIVASGQKDFQQSQQAIQQRQQAAHQKEQRQQETRDNVVGFLFDIFKAIVHEDDEPAPKQQNKVQYAVNIADESAILGVWLCNNALIFIDKNGMWNEFTSNYSEPLFSGTYTIVKNNIINVYNENNKLVLAAYVSIKSNTMSFQHNNGSVTALTYQCSVKEFYAKKDKQLSNLKANTNRFVAEQQGYVTSGQIRNSVNYADTRRSYNEQLIKAQSNLKFYQNFSDDPLFKEDIKKWEDKVYQIEQDMKRLDANAGN